jgi:uncharacterized protein (TIGR02246 family)
MSHHLELAKSYWAAEARRDLEGILSHFAEDAVFISPTMELHGRSEVRRYYEGVMESFGSVAVTVENSVEQGDQLVVEWRAELGASEPDGETRVVLGCNVFTIRADEFARLRVYFNAPDFG